MKQTMILAALAASFIGASAPVQAGFYFEGLMPYTEAPNCNDPYATTCGRYGQVPHQGIKLEKPRHLGDAATRPDRVHEIKPAKPAVRYKTREGLSK